MVILHNIRSAHNVGSIFRTSEAVGVSKIYISGYTPAPVDEFLRENKKISKTALGAEKMVGWGKTKLSVSKLINKLKSDKFFVFAVEQNEKSIDYREIKKTKKMVFVFGNEVRGLSKQILGCCDKILEIPMSGKKESLNVSVSVGIVLFRALD